MKSEAAPPSLKEDQLLRDWFAGQAKWKSWRSLADAVEIPYSSLKKYVGGRPIRVPEHRARIHRMTGIEAFRPESREAERDVPLGLPNRQDSKKTELAIQLRRWLSQQGRFRSVAEMARSIGMAESTLRDYFIGRALPSAKSLNVLKQVTQIPLMEEMKGPGTSQEDKRPQGGVAVDGASLLSRFRTLRKSFAALSDELESLVAHAERRGETRSREPVDQTPAGRSRTIADLVARLRGELEFFKAGSPEDREVLRNVIAGEQVGYVVSLLKVLYDEDAFREWLHFNQLDLTEKR
jgi:hypothetical protein